LRGGIATFAANDGGGATGCIDLPDAGRDVIEIEVAGLIDGQGAGVEELCVVAGPPLPMNPGQGSYRIDSNDLSDRIDAVNDFFGTIGDVNVAGGSTAIEREDLGSVAGQPSPRASVWLVQPE